jgi:hypothetical protein
MSRKKIRRKTQKSRKDVIYFSSAICVRDTASGGICMRETSWEVSQQDMCYMPIYQRAHEMMPIPRSGVMDPEEYLGELSTSVELINQARSGLETKTDELLRALAILGHTPVQKSIDALTEFVQSNHSLASVGSLALGECASLFSVFKHSAVAQAS